MKILTLLLFLVFSGFAADALKSAALLGYETDYKVAIEKAKKEQKMVLMVIVQDPCPYCDKLVHKTLDTPCTQRRMKNYVPLIIDKHDAFPVQFKPPFIPISFIVDPVTEKTTYEIIGAIPYKEYIEDLETEMEFRNVNDD